MFKIFQNFFGLFKANPEPRENNLYDDEQVRRTREEDEHRQFLDREQDRIEDERRDRIRDEERERAERERDRQRDRDRDARGKY